MNQSLTKFGVRFLSRKERTVRRVTKSETKQIQKRLQPVACSSVSSSKSSTSQVERKTVRSRPATLVKQKRESRPKKKDDEIIVIEDESSQRPNKSIHGRVLQTTDLEKLSRLSCSQEFGLFHKQIREELQTNEHQLAFLETKLSHLRNDFTRQLTAQDNLQQIHEFFVRSLNKFRDLQVGPDEFLVLMNKLQEDIKRAIDKWLKKKDFSRVNKQMSECSQKRQNRIQQLIKQSIDEARRVQTDEQDVQIDSS